MKLFDSVFLFSIFFILIITGILSCRQTGCTDRTALNFDSNAQKDDGSCLMFDHSKQVAGLFNGIRITGGYQIGLSQWSDTLNNKDFKVFKSGFNKLRFKGFNLNFSDSLSSSDCFVFLSDTSTGLQWESESVSIQYYPDADSIAFNHTRGNITNADWSIWFGKKL